MKLFSYYKRAIIYPSLFILFFCIIYAIIDYFKSEGLSVLFGIVIPVITSLIFSLLMCGLSLTIFLNKFKKLNKNLIWNILTWFLLPSAYITTILIYDIQIRIKYEFEFGNGFLYLLIMTIPFIIGLSWTFINYRQKITTANTA